ncbi:MAG: hypothetical protein KDJ86_11985 [Bauldia sp.]|uniref:hypothetical protein n=1 Tax=Bauldia sp. TaxID=2575872 RepID=UPI001DED2B77|nr:hypothetical protein [Bauldia sp.]MCB1496500.1 hypothetical protein [Bauldia sp.]
MWKMCVSLLAVALLSAPVLAQGAWAADEDIGIIREKAGTLPHDEALKLLGETLGKSIEATQADPSIPDILDALEANIEATRQIREMVSGAGTVTEEQIAEVASRISTIAKSFDQIARLAPEVFERRYAELSDIDAIGQEVGFRIADANARLASLRQGNEEIDSYVRSETLSHSEIEKLRLTRQANDAEIHSLEAAVAAWGYFSERHADVMKRLGDQSENLDIFFHALKENARVYGAAASTLNMASSLETALSDLGSVENLDSLRSEMVRSWTDLMKIVDEVNDGLRLQPGM